MRGWSAAVLLILGAEPALAHYPIPGITGFPGGLLHPLLVPAHLMALAAFGLLLTQQAPQPRYLLLGIFAASLLVAVAAIASALAADNPDLIVLAAAAILGFLVALGRSGPLAGVALIVFILGAALLLDSVPQEISMRATLLALAGTIITTLAIPALLAALTGLLQRGWHRIGARVVGSWIAASAILVLALRLAK